MMNKKIATSLFILFVVLAALLLAYTVQAFNQDPYRVVLPVMYQGPPPSMGCALVCDEEACWTICGTPTLVIYPYIPPPTPEPYRSPTPRPTPTLAPTMKP